MITSLYSSIIVVTLTTHTISINAQSFTLGLKTLILSNDHYLDLLPRTKLDSYGAPYDLVHVVDENQNKVEIDLDLLYDSNNNPKYNSIVLMSNFLEYKDGDLYPSALNTTQWTELNAYRKNYGVRSVVLQSNSNADPALTYTGPGNGDYADMRFTPDGYVNEFNTNINSNAVFKLGQEYTYMSEEVSFWWYPVGLDHSLNTDNHVKPFMQIKKQTATDYGDDYSAFILTKNDGGLYAQEEMHFTFTANSYTHHGLVLADIWIVWITKGIFLGQRRITLNTHIDDFLIDTELYHDKTVAYRNTGKDLELLKSYQDNRRTTMPERSNFTIELAFNGWGYGKFNDNVKYPTYQPNVDDAVVRLRNDFLWVSHTWTHMDLLCVESNCVKPETTPTLDCYNWTEGVCDYGLNSEGYNEPTYPESGYSPEKYIILELTRNQHWTKNVLFADLSEAEIDSSPIWSGNSIVTPRISGLNYTVAIRAMLEAGIFTAVGDNSRIDLAPENPYHGFNAQPKVQENGEAYDGTFEPVNGRDGLFVIPRFATRIYYDCASPEENADQHNTFYGPECFGWNMTGEISFEGLKCNSSSFKYTENLAFDDILEIEAYETARNLLSYRTDPYMFHQANLHFYDGANCLLSRWIDSTVNEVLKYNTFPILSHKMDDLEVFYRERMERDACNAKGAIEYVNGDPKFMYLTTDSAGECHSRVTITKTQGNNAILGYGSGVGGFNFKESYGVDVTFSYGLSSSNSIKEQLI